ETGRPSGAGAEQVRTGNQSKDRESAWPHCVARAARPRRQSHRIIAMSAFGPKQTSASALHMSAFGGKADMTFRGNPLSRSLLGVKRTSLLAPQMSAVDPKGTCRVSAFSSSGNNYRQHMDFVINEPHH